MKKGRAKGDPQDLQRTGSAEVAIDASSYNSGFGPRDEDVQENYLEAGQYPLFSFTSTAIQGLEKADAASQTWNFTVKGFLEIHGVKRAFQVPVRVTQQDKKITVEGNTTILLKDFNIDTPSIFFLRAGDSVDVSFRLVGERQP